MSQFPPLYSWPIPPTPLAYPHLSSDSIILPRSKESNVCSNYSLPSFPIPKPSASTFSDISTTNFQQHASQMQELGTPHRPTEDEVYLQSLWSLDFPVQRSSTCKFRSSLHLSLKHPPLASSFLSKGILQDGSVRTAELSGFKAQSINNSIINTKSDNNLNYRGSVSTHLEREEMISLIPPPKSLPHNPPPVNNTITINCQHLNPKKDTIQMFDQDPQYNSIYNLNPDPIPVSVTKRQNTVSLFCKLENLNSADQLNLSPEQSQLNSSEITKVAISSPPHPNDTPNNSPSPIVVKLPRKRSLPFSESDSSEEELPEVKFVSESLDDCCFIVSTTTTRMARELKLSPSNVPLTGPGLQAACELYISPQCIKHEESQNSSRAITNEDTTPLPSQSFQQRISPIATEDSTEIRENVSDIQNHCKQNLNKRMRRTPLLSVTKAKTSPIIAINSLPSPRLLSPRKNFLNRSGTNKYGDTLLHRLSQAGQLEAVRRAVMEQQIPVNAQDNAGWTALHEACSSGHLEVAVFLLEHGANPNIASNDGTAPVHDAVTSGDLDFLKLLISYGADPLVYQGDVSPLDMDTDDHIHSYLREIAIQSGHYHPGLPIFPDTPTSPTSLIQPAHLFDSRQTLGIDLNKLKLNKPDDIEQDLFYISPVFETRHEPFLPTYFLPISIKPGCKFMGNFYFLPELLKHLGITHKDLLTLLPDVYIFKFLRCEFLTHNAVNTQFPLHFFPETEMLEFVVETILLQRLLGINIQNMEI
ncbi:hypothetical protein LOD99_7055 [Oopsacas minuta]|uniref:Uncharacterized protein n=1 Tax=Oopsacas minuta TaxID=111878 RepID=A0AAV7JJ31_9METZ|nr:hypothetical protein LOD99_7055 [Oopsacas minuta]